MFKGLHKWATGLEESCAGPENSVKRSDFLAARNISVNIGSLEVKAAHVNAHAHPHPHTREPPSQQGLKKSRAVSDLQSGAAALRLSLTAQAYLGNRDGAEPWRGFFASLLCSQELPGNT